jgi:hypothetical protein
MRPSSIQPSGSVVAPTAGDPALMTEDIYLCSRSDRQAERSASASAGARVLPRGRAAATCCSGAGGVYNPKPPRFARHLRMALDALNWRPAGSTTAL